MDYQKRRKPTREVAVGSCRLGGKNPLRIQSMTNTDPHDARATIAQMLALQAAGCDIVRMTVPDMEAAEVIPLCHRAGVNIPIVADVHFDYRIALRCVDLGIDKIRINPGNIGDDDRVAQVACACRDHHISIRIGVNSGSLEKHLLAKYGAPTPQALCDSARYHMALLEKHGFEDIVVSIKASDPVVMIEANRLLSQCCPYPVHLGVTEAGGGDTALIKSAIGIGTLLCDGIGDTIRVSLTEDPVCEIGAARKILDALHIEGQSGMDIVSCPTCGRTRIDLIALTQKFKAEISAQGLDRLPLRVALMGCVVNGPGEAREADLGIAGGQGEGLLFRHGEILRKIPESELIPQLVAEVRAIARERGWTVD